MVNRQQPTVKSEYRLPSGACKIALVELAIVPLPHFKMEIAVAIIAFCLIASLVMPGLLSREITIALLAFGILYLLMPNLLTTEQALAIIVFGVLFILVIPDLMKKK